MVKGLTAFSWGYFGWGNNAKLLVETVDAVEARRGWEPPMFVDVRIRREVRARDFRGDRFERILGGNRYRWIRELGNLQVAGRSQRMKIADPNAILHLLATIAVQHRQHRRVIFFCSCELPCDCHRRKVATLLLSSAERQGLNLTVTEWPGGTPGKEPKIGALELDRPTWSAIIEGQESVPLPSLRTAEAKRLAALAWGTRVLVRRGTNAMWLASGPARYRFGRWELPVLNWISGPATKLEVLKFAAAEVERLAYGPRHVSGR